MIVPTDEDNGEAIVSRYDKQRYAATSTVEVKGTERAELAELFLANVYDKNRAACHEPGFYVVFKKGSRKLSDFTLCFDCYNMGIKVPFVGEELINFFPTGTGNDQLREVFNRITKSGAAMKGAGQP